MTSEITLKADAVKQRIVRALQCSAGEHEPWARENAWNGGIDYVKLNLKSTMHGEVYTSVCKYCRCIYVRRKDEA